MFILVFCLLIGFALRFYAFDRKSLWIDEVHTFNDSRVGLSGQLKYFKESPADVLHPPLFYALTYLWYPFEKPERDLRIIPLIFGVLSLPMIYSLSALFSYSIALPCTLSLAFMTYHISLSQDARSYSLLMFLGMAGLYFLMKHLFTLKRIYLFLAGFLFAISFYTSYSFVPFAFVFQLLLFYQTENQKNKYPLSSFLILNVVTLLLCMPGILFMVSNYTRQPQMDIAFIEEFGSFWSILSNMLNDWVPFAPLTIISVSLLILFPIFSKNKNNAWILLAILIFPVISIYLFCSIIKFQHLHSSRYVINSLPIFLISLYLSLHTIEAKIGRWKGLLRLKYLFLILFIASNMIILPLYYRSEKQDFRGLVRYLDGHLRDGDKIFVKSTAYIPGILHYFRLFPRNRYYDLPVEWSDAEKHGFQIKLPLLSQERTFTIYYSNACFSRYVEDGSRLWIVAGAPAIREIEKNFPCVLKAYFDGSFGNFRRFPSDASMYLFLWDPQSPDEKGMDLPID